MLNFICIGKKSREFCWVLLSLGATQEPIHIVCSFWERGSVCEVLVLFTADQMFFGILCV